MKKFTSFRSQFKIFSSTLVAAFILCLQACENKYEDITPQDRLATVSEEALQQAEFIDGHYIVVLKDEQAQVNKNNLEGFDQRREKARAYGHSILQERGIPTHVLYSAYGFALSGFAAKLTPAQVGILQADPRVAYIERDQVVRLIEPLSRVSTTSTSSTTGEITPDGIKRVGGGIVTTIYSNRRAYVIDTGILLNHPDLNVETERSKMYNAFCDDINGDDDNPANTPYCIESDRYPNDANGHGTHVAGTIGAKLDEKEGVVGVAPGVRVVPVKVLGSNGSGSLSNILEGLDFVHYDATPGDVANMSLGASGSTTLDNAVKKVADKGVLFSIAAGNDGMNARNYSPARVNHINVFTIAAMKTSPSSNGSWSDSWASFSNYGQPPVDFAAPGVAVYSTYIKKATDGTLEPDYANLSGTSMAAPHVAGLLLLNGTKIGTDKTVKRTAKDIYNIAHR